MPESKGSVFFKRCGTRLVATLAIRLCILCQHQGISIYVEGTVERKGVGSHIAKLLHSIPLSLLLCPGDVFFSRTILSVALSFSFFSVLSNHCPFSRLLSPHPLDHVHSITSFWINPLQLPDHTQCSPDAHAFYHTSSIRPRLITSFTAERCRWCPTLQPYLSTLVHSSKTFHEGSFASVASEKDL